MNQYQYTIERIRRIVAREIDIPPESIGMDDDFHKLGADSLDIVGIHTSIECEFDVIIDDEYSESLMTVRELSRYVEAREP